jgi:Tetracyclin repressor-like, C-terminal domain
VTIHSRAPTDSPTACWADGRATNMIVVSRIAISWAAEMTTSGHQPCAGARCSASAAWVCSSMAGDYFADPTLVPDWQAQALQTGNEVMTAILKRAAERGEARDDIPPRVSTLPIDLLRHELLLSSGDERAITEIVDQVFLPLVLVFPS